jgi:hypothetical protein
MASTFDPELHRLEVVLRRAEKRLEWMNRSVLDAAALQAAGDLCEKAREDLATHSRKQTLSGAKPSRLRV